MFHCYIFNATANLPHLNPHFPLFLLSFHIYYFHSPPVLSFLSTLSFPFPLYGLSAHCFHVLLLSFSILACLAHFSVTVNWILYFHRSALTYLLNSISLHYTLFLPPAIILIATHFYSSCPHLSLVPAPSFPPTLIKFPSHPSIIFPDPERRDAGGVV